MLRKLAFTVAGIVAILFWISYAAHIRTGGGLALMGLLLLLAGAVGGYKWSLRRWPID
jgi:hypothetical protein